MWVGWSGGQSRGGKGEKTSFRIPPLPFHFSGIPPFFSPFQYLLLLISPRKKDVGAKEGGDKGNSIDLLPPPIPATAARLLRPPHFKNTELVSEEED